LEEQRLKSGEFVGEIGGKQGALGVQAQFEAAKWLAIVAMAIDHFGKIVAPDLYVLTHVIGRISFPLLAWIVACRLATRPGVARSYLIWLVPFALLSQPVFVLAGREIWDGNILFTLALGVGASVLIDQATEKKWGVLALLLVAALSMLVEFGPIGVATIVVLRLISERRFTLAAWAVGPIGVLANFSLSDPMLSLFGLAATFASPIAILTLRAVPDLPRIPKVGFYLFYPLHLLVLHLWDVL
jgi:hypothetical protein